MVPHLAACTRGSQFYLISTDSQISSDFPIESIAVADLWKGPGGPGLPLFLGEKKRND